VNVALIPLAQTQVSWDSLVKITQAATKRSVTAPLDARGIHDRDCASAIAAYGEFACAFSDYLSTLREPGGVLKHFSVSFLAMCDGKEFLLECACEGDLKILLCDDHEKLFVVTASLEAWRTTIINYARNGATIAQRNFAKAAIQQFDKMGLAKLWDAYSRSLSENGGLVLCHK
jgi:hypothetical protein